MSSPADTSILLVLGILVLGFIAYEEAALQFGSWHTVSWYAAHNAWLKAALIVAFLIGGVVGAVWFGHHADPALVPK